jgi:glyoxylase-like metal-dependent hydrolase (beta-lactamase superfamily II)
MRVVKSVPDSYHHVRAGDVDIYTFVDGKRPDVPIPDSPALILNRTHEQIDKYLTEAGYKPRVLTHVFNPVVVRTAGKVVVFDTGFGPAAANAPNSPIGHLCKNMEAAGIKREDVDYLVISHSHGDHINGVLTDGKPTWPNAQVMVPEGEWNFWMNDEEMAKAPPGRITEIFHNFRKQFGPIKDKVKIFKAGEEILPNITVYDAPGHCVGHVAFMVNKGADRVFLQHDVSNVPYIFVRDPDIETFWDQDSKQAVKSRRKAYDMVSAEKIPVQGFHFPFPSFGYIEKDGSGYRYVPTLQA